MHGRHVEGFARSSETKLTMGERGEIIGLRKDGSEFPAEASVTKLQQGSETLFVLMLRDVSERKRIMATLLGSEHALRKRIADLEEAQLGLQAQGDALTRLADDLIDRYRA